MSHLRKFIGLLIVVFNAHVYGSNNTALVNNLTAACDKLTSACQELVCNYEEIHNPNYLPLEPCCFWGTLNFYGEYLWWNINQNGLHYAISGVQNNPPAAGKLFSLDGRWNSGFRIGGGIRLPPCLAWKITLDWLRFRADRMDAARAGGLTLRATRGLPAADIDILDAAFSSLDFKLDSIRLAMTAPLFTRAHLALLPWCALRYDSISENFRISYDGTGTDFSNFRNTNQFSGIGPEVGFEASWFILPCIALLGELKGAGMYGSYDIHQVSTDNNGDEDVNFRHNIERLQTTLETMIGARWEGVFFRKVFLCLKLGWETNIWFNFNTIYSFLSASEEGNLSDISDNLCTTGLTFRASIAF